MDKRFNPITLQEQMSLRRKAVEDVLAHPEWDLRHAVRHVRETLRLTTREMAQLAGVSFRTLQELEQGRSTGTVQTLDRLLGVLGLRLGVTDRPREEAGEAPPSQAI